MRACFQRTFDTFFVYLTVLGAWPFLIGTLFVRKKMNSVDCMFAVTFLVFFVAAACVGRTVERLFLYSYPALVIIVPWFVMKMESPVLRRRFAFVTGLFQAAGLYFIYFHV